MSDLKSTERYGRLEKLFSLLGDELRENIEVDGLIYAFTAGFELVGNCYDELDTHTDINTFGETALRRWCGILDIEYDNYEADELKTLIKEKLSASYDEFNADDFVSWYFALGSNYYTDTSDYVLTLYGLSSSDFELIADIMHKLAYYLPPFIEVHGDGDGITWDTLENNSFTWKILESLEIPWSVFETISI